MDVVGAITEEVGEQVLRSGEEEVDVFIVFDGVGVNGGGVLGEGGGAGDGEVEGAVEDGEVELVTAY